MSAKDTNGRQMPIPIRASARELSTKAPRRVPVLATVRGIVLDSDELFQGLQSRLPPNGNTGSKSWDKYVAVDYLKEYDAKNGGMLTRVPHVVVWKALKTVGRELGIMELGLLVPPPATPRGDTAAVGND